MWTLQTSLGFTSKQQTVGVEGSEFDQHVFSFIHATLMFSKTALHPWKTLRDLLKRDPLAICLYVLLSTCKPLWMYKCSYVLSCLFVCLIVLLKKKSVELISVAKWPKGDLMRCSSNKSPLYELVGRGTFLKRRALTQGQLTSVPGSITYYLWSNVCEFCMHCRVPHKRRIMSLFPYVHIFMCQGFYLSGACGWLRSKLRIVSHPATHTFTQH